MLRFMFLTVTGTMCVMAPTSEDLNRLAHAVMNRRQALRMTKEAAARRADINSITWNRVESGLAVRDVTYSAVQDALGWEAGTVSRILDGEPAPTDPGAVTVTESQRDGMRVLLTAIGDVDEATQQDAIDAALAVLRAHKRGSH